MTTIINLQYISVSLGFDYIFFCKVHYFYVSAALFPCLMSVNRSQSCSELRPKYLMFLAGGTTVHIHASSSNVSCISQERILQLFFKDSKRAHTHIAKLYVVNVSVVHSYS